MRRCLLIKAICFLTFSLLWIHCQAQDSVQYRLTTQDIELFILTYENLTTELKVIAQKYKGGAMPGAVDNSYEESVALFIKYGWSENFKQKLNAINNAFTYATLEMQIGGSPQLLQASLDDLLPQYKQSTNDLDIELVKSYYDELNALIGTE